MSHTQVRTRAGRGDGSRVATEDDAKLMLSLCAASCSLLRRRRRVSFSRVSPSSGATTFVVRRTRRRRALTAITSLLDCRYKAYLPRMRVLRASGSAAPRSSG